MTLDQGQTETNDIQEIDDVEGHSRAHHSPTTETTTSKATASRPTTRTTRSTPWVSADSPTTHRAGPPAHRRRGRTTTSTATAGLRSPTRTPRTTSPVTCRRS